MLTNEELETAAAFFVTYETIKESCKGLGMHPAGYSIIAACIAEVVSFCLFGIQLLGCLCHKSTM